MIDAGESFPLADFQKNTKRHIERLRKSRRPGVVTVNGRAAFVVIDPRAFSKLVNKAAQADDIEAIRRGLNDADAGRHKPLDEVMGSLRRRAGQLARTPPARRRSA